MNRHGITRWIGLTFVCFAGLANTLLGDERDVFGFDDFIPVSERQFSGELHDFWVSFAHIGGLLYSADDSEDSKFTYRTRALAILRSNFYTGRFQLGMELANFSEISQRDVSEKWVESERTQFELSLGYYPKSSLIRFPWESQDVDSRIRLSIYSTYPWSLTHQVDRDYSYPFSHRWTLEYERRASLFGNLPGYTVVQIGGPIYSKDWTYDFLTARISSHQDLFSGHRFRVRHTIQFSEQLDGLQFGNKRWSSFFDTGIGVQLFNALGSGTLSVFGGASYAIKPNQWQPFAALVFTFPLGSKLE